MTKETALPSIRSWSSRPYETERDLAAMQAMLMAGRSQAGDWRFAHVGELVWDFFMVACHLDPHGHIRLWHAMNGGLVAYAILSEDPVFNYQVLPEYAGIGIEAEALAWADEVLDTLRQRDAQRWGGNLTSGARQDDLKRIAFLEQHGFRPGEYVEVNFLLRLDQAIPDTVPPSGCQVRSVLEDAGEIPARAAAQREVWQPWTVGDVSDGDYACFMRLPGYDRDLDVVAVTAEGVIAAYVNGWVDPVNRIGDFGPVGARPAYRRQGWTRAVLLECLRRMLRCGMDRVCVSTGEQNTPAIRLYESVGFIRVNRYVEYIRTD